MTVARFWREQKNRYNLLGIRCDNCEKVFFPPREICSECHRKSIGKMMPYKLTGNGRIISYTIIHEGTETFKNQIPYVLAIIELDEGPRVTGQVVDVPFPKDVCKEPDELGTQETNCLTIGTKVTSVFRKISEDGKSGTIHYGYKFKLIPE